MSFLGVRRCLRFLCAGDRVQSAFERLPDVRDRLFAVPDGMADSEVCTRQIRHSPLFPCAWVYVHERIIPLHSQVHDHWRCCGSLRRGLARDFRRIITPQLLA
jgi:hypothetical protein